EHCFVVAHERALELALGRIAEWIEGGSAEEFEFREQPEERENPRPERHLFRLAGDFVAAGEKRRGQDERRRAGARRRVRVSPAWRMIRRYRGAPPRIRPCKPSI